MLIGSFHSITPHFVVDFFLEIYFLSVAAESRFRFINKSTNEKKAIFGWPNASRFFFQYSFTFAGFFVALKRKLMIFGKSDAFRFPRIYGIYSDLGKSRVF